MWPQRYLVTPELRTRFGARVDRLAPFLLRSDPLADAVVDAIAELGGKGWRLLDRALHDGINNVPDAPEAFRALFHQLDHVPYWTSDDAIDRGGALVIRTGILSGLALGLGSLVMGYCAPAGNKPLVMSGRLYDSAAPRLNETAKFLYAVCKPGGMRRFAEGFHITVKVRLIHAQVRRMILRTGDWSSELWGHPINQQDMAGTILLFSQVLIDGLRTLGATVETAEAERYLGLWRYVGHVIGVEHELLTANERDAHELFGLISSAAAPPDDDSRSLVKALMEVPLVIATTGAEREAAAKQLPVRYAICRALIGDELADGLHLPSDSWRFTIPALRAVLKGPEVARRVLPLGEDIAYVVGRRYWEMVLEKGMAVTTMEFGLPQRLARARDARA